MERIFFVLFLSLLIQRSWSEILLDNNDEVEITVNSTNEIIFSYNKTKNFSNLLLIEKKQWLFVSGDDYVFRLNSKNINDSTSYKARETPKTNKTPNITSSKVNSIRLLIHRSSQADLIACGTNLGKSHIYDLKESDLSNQIEYNGQYLCPSTDKYSNLGLSTQVMGSSLMFSALWLDDSKYGIFRKDVEYNGHFLRTMDSTRWLREPNFIAMIEYGESIFVFFTELDSTGLDRVSRIAIICKSDKGISSVIESENYGNVWSSFRKVSFECQMLNLEFINLKNMILVKRIDEHMAIAVFYLEVKQNSKIFNSGNFSIFCEISLKNLTHLFHDYVDCENSANDEHFQNSENDVLIQHKHFKSISSFVTNNTLKNLHTNSLSPCLSMVYAQTMDKIIVLIRIDNNEQKQKTNVLFNLKPNIGSNDSINDLLVDQQNEYLYFATARRVYQIDLTTIKNNVCDLFVQFNGDFFNILLRWCNFFKEKQAKCLPIINKIVLTKTVHKTIAKNLSTLLDCNLTHPILYQKRSLVKWFKDQKAIDHRDARFRVATTGELLITDSNSEKAGIYECRVESFNYKYVFNVTFCADCKHLQNEAYYVSDLEKIRTRFVKLESKFNLYFNQCNFIN